MQTAADFVEAMQREYTEIQSIEENIKELKDKAKEKGHDPAMLAKIAKAMAAAKVEDLREKSEELVNLIDNIRNT